MLAQTPIRWRRKMKKTSSKRQEQMREWRRLNAEHERMKAQERRDAKPDYFVVPPQGVRFVRERFKVMMNLPEVLIAGIIVAYKEWEVRELAEGREISRWDKVL